MENIVKHDDKNEYIEKLNEKYYDFMKYPYGSYRGCLDQIVNDYQKKEYVEVFKEIIDTSLPKVQCLDEDETKIIRKLIGVNGESYPNLKKLSDDLNTNYSIIYKKTTDLYLKLRNRIIRGFVDLKEAYLNGDITKEEICTLPIDALFGLTPKTRSFENFVILKGIKTIGNLLDYSIDTIQSKSHLYVGIKTLNTLVDYIHDLGLNFKDENIREEKGKKELEDWNQFVGFDTVINFDSNIKTCENSNQRKTVKLKLLLEKLKEISEKEDSYDKEIRRLMEKKLKLQESKNELLNEILNIKTDKPNEEKTEKVKKNTLENELIKNF